MGNQIYGRDLSHHNWYNQPLKSVVFADGKEAEFIILKATEGKTYKDPRFVDWIKKIWDAYPDMILGAYHYARPENNYPAEEAKNFLSVVKPYIGRMVFALDWEGIALTRGTSNWALNWLNYIYKETGVKPLFYCQQSAVRNYPEIQSSDYGLWVARYNDILGNIQPWDYYTIWQYNDKPYDMDVFNGTKEQMWKYAESELIKPKCPHGHIDCPYLKG